MSVDFYLQRAQPISVSPRFHIAKCEEGYAPLYDENLKQEDVWSFPTERPVVSSLDDIRRYSDSGEWAIVGEDGGALSYEEFIEGIEQASGQHVLGSDETLDIGSPIERDGLGNAWLR